MVPQTSDSESRAKSGKAVVLAHAAVHDIVHWLRRSSPRAYWTTLPFQVQPKSEQKRGGLEHQLLKVNAHTHPLFIAASSLSLPCQEILLPYFRTPLCGIDCMIVAFSLWLLFLSFLLFFLALCWLVLAP